MIERQKCMPWLQIKILFYITRCLQGQRTLCHETFAFFPRIIINHQHLLHSLFFDPNRSPFSQTYNLKRYNSRCSYKKSILYFNQHWNTYLLIYNLICNLYQLLKIISLSQSFHQFLSQSQQVDEDILTLFVESFSHFNHKEVTLGCEMYPTHLNPLKSIHPAELTKILCIIVSSKSFWMG